ncbi:hypothetical protein [Anaerococcus sp.]|uniref:hypothetical protein n=1 Tax=Anaerococcus sp. TaxID=1872515 RepID=UPI0027BA949C|nr:hypothetical protein [Anaerococcus sp.]
MNLQLILIIISGAVTVLGGAILQYNIYQMTKIDARARGLKHPKLLGVLNISGNNGNAFLLAYLIGRKKYPIQNLGKRDKESLETYKKKSRLALAIHLIGGAVFIVLLIYYKNIFF